MVITLQKTTGSDEFKTPEYIVKVLIPFIPKEVKIVWECASNGGSLISKVLRENGYELHEIADYFSNSIFHTSQPKEYDAVITNPPYSLKTEFLEQAYSNNKPFAFLMPVTTLEDADNTRHRLFKRYGIQLILPDHRTDFITPTGKGSGSWFLTCWFCWKFNLPEQLNFVHMDKPENMKKVHE